MADLLEETGRTQLKTVDTALEVSTKLEHQVGERLKDQGKYRRIVGKVLFLTMTRPDISFAVNVVSQFM